MPLAAAPRALRSRRAGRRAEPELHRGASLFGSAGREQKRQISEGLEAVLRANDPDALDLLAWRVERPGKTASVEIARKAAPTHVTADGHHSDASRSIGSADETHAEPLDPPR